jgi:hypothetical protein
MKEKARSLMILFIMVMADVAVGWTPRLDLLDFDGF